MLSHYVWKNLTEIDTQCVISQSMYVLFSESVLKIFLKFRTIEQEKLVIADILKKLLLAPKRSIFPQFGLKNLYAMFLRSARKMFS